jgi:hypothetical protein
MRATSHISRLLTAAFVLAAAPAAFAADDGAWTVSKSSGEVWLTNSGAQPASLKQEEMLKPGDTIRTGRTGRVLLKRGEESMMISPNSVIGVPAEKKEGLSTTIQQKAGSILLEVEKRNVKHFEVETPYLAAVVKGTQFRVTVNATSTSVDVIRGQVEVADFRTGQIAQVMPGQHATTFSNGNGGLSLSGTGTLSPIEQGKPRTPSIERVPVPRAGLSAPRSTVAAQTVKPAGVVSSHADKPSQRQAGVAHVKPGVVRISSSIGEVKLNVHKVTNGLARDRSSVNAGTRNVASKDTVWGSSGSSNSSGGGTSYVANTSAGNGASSGNTSSGNASSGNAGSGSTSGSSVSSTVATVTGAATSGGSSGNKGNGKTNNGNHGEDNNGNGNGNNGANGNGKTNNGNHGEGNNGNGNGNGGSNGNGHGKKS